MEQINSRINRPESEQNSEMVESSGKLDWDSNFFGFDVATIKVGSGNDRQIVEEINKYQHVGSRLIYVCTPRQLDLSMYNAFPVDRKRSYKLCKPRFKETKNQVLSVTENQSGLYSLAYQAGAYSRYKVDPNIGEEDFERLYRMWIDNSVSRRFADYVLTVVINDIPVGLITAKVKGETLSIGLFATDKEYQGNGIGSDLLQSVVNIAAEKNMSVEVTTQADNKIACDFYEHKGFVINHEEYIYHVWNK